MRHEIVCDAFIFQDRKANEGRRHVQAAGIGNSLPHGGPGRSYYRTWTAGGRNGYGIAARINKCPELVQVSLGARLLRVSIEPPSGRGLSPCLSFRNVDDEAA